MTSIAIRAAERFSTDAFLTPRLIPKALVVKIFVVADFGCAQHIMAGEQG